MNDEPEKDKYGNTYVPDNKLPDSKKVIFKDAFPEFIDKYNEQQNKKIADTYDNDGIYNTIRNGLHVSFELNGHNNVGIGAHEFFTHMLQPSPPKKKKEKKPVKKYTITVIDLKRQVGVEGIAVVDPNELDKKRIGRMPKKKQDKKLINKFRQEKELEEKKKQERENNKKQYELKLF